MPLSTAVWSVHAPLMADPDRIIARLRTGVTTTFLGVSAMARCVNWTPARILCSTRTGTDRVAVDTGRRGRPGRLDHRGGDDRRGGRVRTAMAPHDEGTRCLRARR